MLVDILSHYSKRNTHPVRLICSGIFRIDSPSNDNHVNTCESLIVIEDDEVNRNMRKI